MTRKIDRRITLGLGIAALFATHCGGVSNDAAARKTYVGLDRGVDRALSLAFAGFNAASSANIPPQMASGDLAGTMLVEGQVSQGSSANREMRLQVTLTDYRDMVSDNGDGGTGAALRLIYSKPTNGTPITMDISLRPPAFTGTFVGTLNMTGELEAAVTVNIAMAGQLEAVAGTTNNYQRVAGSTRITGTVTSSYGTYNVDVTR